MPMPRHLRPLVVVLVALAGTSACARPGASATEASAGRVEVVDGQVAVPANPDQAAARFVIRNTGAVDDRLVAVSSPDAGSVAIHRSEIDSQGRALMTEVTSLAVPARSTVTFEPGGLHVMLADLHRRLRVGDIVSLRLEFAEAGSRHVELDVVDAAAMAMGDGHDHDG